MVFLHRGVQGGIQRAEQLKKVDMGVLVNLFAHAAPGADSKTPLLNKVDSVHTTAGKEGIQKPGLSAGLGGQQ